MADLKQKFFFTYVHFLKVDNLRADTTRLTL